MREAGFGGEVLAGGKGEHRCGEAVRVRVLRCRQVWPHAKGGRQTAASLSGLHVGSCHPCAVLRVLGWLGRVAREEGCARACRARAAVQCEH